jgi:hypothetical protein
MPTPRLYAALRQAKKFRLRPDYVLMFGGGMAPPPGEWQTEDVMEERDFYDERQETRKATLNCPHCHQAGEYDLGWFVRTKKRQLPGRADERDRAKFAKARSYMVRRDDLVACKNVRCRKRFEVSGVQSVAFLDEQVQPERRQ